MSGVIALVGDLGSITNITDVRSHVAIYHHASLVKRGLGPSQIKFIAERLLKPEKFDRAEQFHGIAAMVRTARAA